MAPTQFLLIFQLFSKRGLNRDLRVELGPKDRIILQISSLFSQFFWDDVVGYKLHGWLGMLAMHPSFTVDLFSYGSNYLFLVILILHSHWVQKSLLHL
jgi:hypothetical protein